MINIIVNSIGVYAFIWAMYCNYLHIFVYNHSRFLYCIVRGFFWWAFAIKKIYATIRAVLSDLS
jgi:nitrogen fixation-related uncharacterized protein